jgi:hypothetical protein
MKFKFRGYRLKRWSVLLLLFLARFTAGYAQGYMESFNDITTLPGAGWVLSNNSTPVGTTSWFQGIPVLMQIPAPPMLIFLLTIIIQAIQVRSATG